MATVAPHELDPADLDSISPEELERQWAKVAIETGQLLARHNIQGTPVSEVTDALAEAKVHNRPVRASELILHISASESPMPDLKEIAHMRLFLANAYPGIELESLSPLQLRRICDIIPSAALAKKDEFHHRARPNLDSQLQRLQRYLAGESDAQISADESVSATAIALGRNTLAKNIGKLVSFDDLTDAASAQLLNAIAANRAPSLEDVITGIRDGTIEEEEPKVFDYEPSGELVFPQNFDAEVVTFLNTSRTNVHINEIIWTFFGRRLETPEYLEVRKFMYALAGQGYITSQGKGYFATYGTPEDLVEEASTEAEPEEFVLPDDFGDQIVDLVSSQPRMHVGEITRHFFEERLQTEEFAKVRELFFDLCASGRLINLGAGYYKVPGRIVEEPSYDDHSEHKSLDQMLRDAGIRGGGGFKPNKRSRRRS